MDYEYFGGLELLDATNVLLDINWPAFLSKQNK